MKIYEEKNNLGIYIKPVFEFLRKIPKGKVVTYKIVANVCGLINPRNVSWVLRQNSGPLKIPCYKVVLSNGYLAQGYKFGGPREQAKYLKADGIVVSEKNRIKEFKKHLWLGES